MYTMTQMLYLRFYPNKSEFPEHMVVQFKPNSIGSKMRGEIQITYDPIAKNDLGFVRDPIKIFTSDSSVPEKELHVVATLEEYFPLLTQEELAKSPKLKMSKKRHDFKTVTMGNKLVKSFKLYNQGFSPLIIRKIKSNCECVVAELGKNKIEPGLSTNMKVIFNTEGRTGVEYKNVSIFSNDPSSPSQVITIRAKIVN